MCVFAFFRVFSVLVFYCCFPFFLLSVQATSARMTSALSLCVSKYICLFVCVLNYLLVSHNQVNTRVCLFVWVLYYLLVSHCLTLSRYYFYLSTSTCASFDTCVSGQSQISSPAPTTFKHTYTDAHIKRILTRSHFLFLHTATCASFDTCVSGQSQISSPSLTTCKNDPCTSK
jgi:hypothetical protein